ncbi:hypothetical protein KIM67_02790 [Flagellimonas sp. 389]|uniref:hypothetical protein n=1 Tax=Flagellimonas sp. 389 TaxID=2835862 RepID=UPI001BD4FA47|nr:hypothetical protein [Flagellimonas sp. 389]MBS9461322.1 hypothetical protein [Flagellimonas sp. 389]
MDVSDFNDEGDIEIKPNEPSRDQLGVFYWGRTGNTKSSVHDLKYSYQEFYVSTYSDLYQKYGPEFDMDFNLVRDKKIQQCE